MEGPPIKLSETEFTQKAIDVFKECSLVPSLTRARILPHSDTNFIEIEATWTEVEVERQKKTAFTKSYFVQRKGCSLEKICNSAFPADATQM